METTALYKNSGHPVCILDAKYIIKQCNNNFCKCFKFIQSEICGSDFLTLIKRDQQSRVRKILDSKLLELNQIEEEVPLIDNLGKTVNFKTTFINHNGTAEKRNVLVVCRKNSGNEILYHDAENTLRQLLDNSLAGISVISIGGNILFINDYNCFFTETIKEKLVGNHYRQIIHQDDYPMVSSNFSDILSGTARERSLVHRINYKKGRSDWFRSGIHLVKDRKGSPVYTIMISHNVTREVQLENELIDVKLDLLTSKESELLMHLSLGLSRREIAREMDIADATYDKHLKNMKTKLKKKNTKELIEFSFMSRRNTGEKKN